MKNVLLLEHYYSPDELRQRLTEWVDYYNHQRYHESLENVRPADAYWGRQEQIVAERQKIKQLTMAQRRKVIFFSEFKVHKSISSLFTRICPLSVDDIHLYAMAVEVIIQSAMYYDMGLELSMAFKYGRHNNEWSPCNIKVLDHLPHKIPVQIPPPDDAPYISTIYNDAIDIFLEKLDLSDCTGREGDEQFRSWFSIAKEYQKDVVLFLW